MKFKSNEEGRCPICNSQMIEYFGMELEDTAVYFPWHCPDCDTDGKEWYYVNFSEVRSNDDKIGSEEGICPDCGAEIEYGTAEPDGNSLGYEYFCPECENSGREWYDLDFDSHTIDGHEGEEIELEEDLTKNYGGQNLEKPVDEVKKAFKNLVDTYNTQAKLKVERNGEQNDLEYINKTVSKSGHKAFMVKFQLDEIGGLLTGGYKIIYRGIFIDTKSMETEDYAYGQITYKLDDKDNLMEPVQEYDDINDFIEKINNINVDDLITEAKHKEQEARNPENDEINAKIRSALFGSTKYNKDLEDAGFILDTYGPKNKVNSIHYKDNDKYLYRGKMYNSNKDTDYYNYLTKKSPITWSEKTTNLSNAYGNVSSKKDVTTNGEYFSNGWNTVVGKAMPKRFKTNKSSVMVTEPYGSETIEKYKKFNDTISSKKSDLQDDIDNINNLQNDIAEKQNNINNTQKEIDQLEKDKQDLIANKKQEAVSKDVDIIWTNGFTLDKLKDDIKNNFDDIKETIDICDVEDREQGTSVYLAKYEGNLYLTLSKHNKDDYDDDFENTATVYVNKDKIANSNEAEFKKYILYLYNYLLGLDKPIKLGESSEDNGEENDNDLLDTISLLDMALSEIPTTGVEDWGKDDELLFTADTKVLFENLKSYEHKIPRSYYDNAENDDWSNGIDKYLEDKFNVDIENGESDNTYNWNAPLTHDVEFTVIQAGSKCFFKASIHRAGDVRGNYTTEFLLEFNDKDDCYEAIFDACSENCCNEVTLDGVNYVIEPHFFNEYVSIFDYTNDISYDEVYCCCIDELKEIIAENKKDEEPVEESKDYVSANDKENSARFKEWCDKILSEPRSEDYKKGLELKDDAVKAWKDGNIAEAYKIWSSISDLIYKEESDDRVDELRKTIEWTLITDTVESQFIYDMADYGKRQYGEA